MSEGNARILVVDDEIAITHALKTLLQREGYHVDVSDGFDDALRRYDAEPFDLVISDVVMKPRDGIELLKELQQRNPRLPVIMITGRATEELTRQAREIGIFELVRKPFRILDMMNVVQRALTIESLHGGSETQRVALHYHFDELVGESMAMQRVFRAIKDLALSRTSVVFCGELGTGRTAAARALHNASPRANDPLLQIDCINQTETNLARFLLGGGGRRSCLANAHGGSVMLDHLEALPVALQHKLADLFSRGDTVVTKEGGELRADTRLIATASEQLETLMSRGEIAESLYRQMQPVEIELPPLRDRLEDLPMLVQHFLVRHQYGDMVIGQVDSGVLAALERYGWPGNLRELEQVVQHSVEHCVGGRVQFADLPPEIREVFDAADNQGLPAPPRVDPKWASLQRYLVDTTEYDTIDRRFRRR